MNNTVEASRLPAPRLHRGGRITSELGPGLLEDGPQLLLDLVEVLLVADQWRSELDDGVAAVVGATVQPRFEQLLGQEAAEQLLRLGVVERLLGRRVLDHLDAVEVPVAA